MMIRRARIPCCILWLAALPAFLVPGTALAQSFHIESQHITADLTGMDFVVDVDATVKAIAPFMDLPIPAFGMPIQSATVDGATVPMVPDAMYPQYVIHLVLGSTVAAGGEAHVHLRARGAPMCASQNVPRHIDCEWTPGQEAVVALPEPGEAFYLFNLFNSDPFVGDVTVLAPPDFEVVAGQGSGTVTSTTPGGAKTWKFSFTTPTENVPIYATNGTSETSTTAFRVRGYFRDDVMKRADMHRAVNLAGRIIPFYEDLYAMPVPVDEAHIMIVPPSFAFGGLGFLGDVVWADYVIGAYDFLLEQGVAHEFAHTWWGNLASGSDPGEAPFLAEAFAEYTAWRGLGEIHGDQMRTAGVRMNAVWYMYTRPQGVDVAILDPNVGSSPAYVHAIYHKGSTVVRTLEESVGTEAFTRALQKFLKRGYGGLSVQGLIADMYHETGRDPTPDVTQWMTKTGFPHVKAEVSYDPAGTDATVSIHTTGAFTYHAPVRFTFSDGTTTDGAIEVMGPDETKHFALSKRPAFVEIDPRWTFVRELKPAMSGDLTLDGEIDAADLIELALHRGALPPQRRRDGHYDPFYDVDGDHVVGDQDLAMIVSSAHVLGQP